MLAFMNVYHPNSAVPTNISKLTSYERLLRIIEEVFLTRESGNEGVKHGLKRPERGFLNFNPSQLPDPIFP
jgi:hypothetical protein